jgi:hypothetical protein
MSVTHALFRRVTVNCRCSRFGIRTAGLPTASVECDNHAGLLAWLRASAARRDACCSLRRPHVDRGTCAGRGRCRDSRRMTPGSSEAVEHPLARGSKSAAQPMRSSRFGATPRMRHIAWTLYCVRWALMKSYVDRTRPVLVFVDMGIDVRCGYYLSTESWEFHRATVAQSGHLGRSAAIMGRPSSAKWDQRIPNFYRERAHHYSPRARQRR